VNKHEEALHKNFTFTLLSIQVYIRIAGMLYETFQQFTTYSFSNLINKFKQILTKFHTSDTMIVMT